jgi:hypothetical protein
VFGHAGFFICIGWCGTFLRRIWHVTFQSFQRVGLGSDATHDTKVEARLENGILRIHLPKHEAARPRKIVVKA